MNSKREKSIGEYEEFIQYPLGYKFHGRIA